MVRVAIVHDWLVTYAGAERVLEQLLLLYPDADLFAVCDFLPEAQRGFLRGRSPTTTFIQHLPGARKRYRTFLPLMPLAIEQLDVSGYDIVISSSHAVSKGVLTGPNQLHVSYVHTPIRYAWDLQHQYLREAGLSRGLKAWLARVLLHRIRLWDARTSNGVDVFVGNSRFVARRIMKTYRRESSVVHPPVDVDAFSVGDCKEGFYLTASRLVPYKRVDLIVEAFARMPSRQLVLIGDGPERAKIERLAAGLQNVHLLWYQPTATLIDYMRRARAFVFAAEEDFGITPVEAQACGTPVIAFGRGGALETVRGQDTVRPTGVFFHPQSSSSIVNAVEYFESQAGAFNPSHCRENAEKFSADRFRREFSALVEREWASFNVGRLS